MILLYIYLIGLLVSSLAGAVYYGFLLVGWREHGKPYDSHEYPPIIIVFALAWPATAAMGFSVGVVLGTVYLLKSGLEKAGQAVAETIISYRAKKALAAAAAKQRQAEAALRASLNAVRRKERAAEAGSYRVVHEDNDGEELPEPDWND